MIFTPCIYILSNHIGGAAYLIYETIAKMSRNLQFEREIFTLSDGGTIAIDWYVDKNGGKPTGRD